MKTTKTAIVLTEHVMDRGAKLAFIPKAILIPATRIAKVEPFGPVDAYENPPKSKLTLRTPEEYIFAAESIEEIAALMNGQ